MGDTTIEWTRSPDGSKGKTWNVLRGCSRKSEGCVNCYAETYANRFKGPGKPYEGLIAKGGQWNGQIKFVPGRLQDPLRWKKPHRIFVNSMSDLFHENVTDEWIDQIFAVMALSPQHTFQILTKRPERMLKYMTESAEISNGQLTKRHSRSAAFAEKQANVLRWSVLLQAVGGVEARYASLHRRERSIRNPLAKYRVSIF